MLALWYCVKVSTGGAEGGGLGGGGLWTTIRQKGRPVSPPTQQRWSEPWMAISWCFSTNTRLLATPRNAGSLSCHHAVVSTLPPPRLFNAWIYIEGTPSRRLVSIRGLSGKDVEQVACLDRWAETKVWPEIDRRAN